MTEIEIDALLKVMGNPKLTPTEREVLEMTDEEIDNEYELIRRKESQLSKTKRDGVVVRHEMR